MSHILKFKIEGLAGRTETFEKTLDRHVNIFFGLNGGGKTSLLKILHSAMTGDASLLRLVPFTTASVSIFSLKNKKDYTYTIKQSPLTNANLGDQDLSQEDELRVKSTKPATTLVWKCDSKVKTNGWAHQYLPTSRLLIGGTRNRLISRTLGITNTTMSEEEIDMLFSEAIQKLWLAYSSRLLTTVNMAQQDGLASILKAVISSTSSERQKPSKDVDSHKAYERMKQFVTRQGSHASLCTESDFKKRFDIDPTLRQVVSDIDRIEGEIDQASAPRRNLESLIKQLFSGGKNISFTDQSIDVKTANGIEIGTSKLSSGEKHLLMILVETLLADQSSIIIDEPEISMHVDWQRALIKNMRILAPHAQIIIASHSPEVMADISDDLITRM